ncbi:MAG: NADH-quinone oxidoreductase subunit L, partial [Gemmatimonadetes bacterium]|nr:NADH-quinone oxidoreductase subunit L [Gemmatimonadota bacterium]
MTESFSYVWLIPFLPLLGAFINVFFNRNPRVSGMIACAMVAASFLLALGVFLQLIGLPAGERSVDVVVYSWITTGTFAVDVAFLVDPLSTVMMLVVTGVGLLIHVYSIGYMGKDACCVRYFSYLNLFMFAMLILVMGNNFLLMFVGWEGVGLCSYLLIGFWCERQSAANAGMKAFVVNRIGDFAFILGLLLIFLYAGSLTYADVFAADPAVLAPVITAVTLLIFIGAMGKSAQVPLHVWLPDAMEGPTPVSALIHAATMVTAGVYMVARCHVLFAQSATAMTVVAVVGAVTAIFAAYIALTQYDIKRVLAYSTVSQLGYMFLACGVGYFTAGIFHLVTHAFFKALLFMG